MGQDESKQTQLRSKTADNEEESNNDGCFKQKKRFSAFHFQPTVLCLFCRLCIYIGLKACSCTNPTKFFKSNHSHNCFLGFVWHSTCCSSTFYIRFHCWQIVFAHQAVQNRSQRFQRPRTVDCAAQQPRHGAVSLLSHTLCVLTPIVATPFACFAGKFEKYAFVAHAEQHPGGPNDANCRQLCGRFSNSSCCKTGVVERRDFVKKQFFLLFAEQNIKSTDGLSRTMCFGGGVYSTIVAGCDFF